MFFRFCCRNEEEDVEMKNYYFGMMEEFQEAGKIDTANTGSIF